MATSALFMVGMEGAPLNLAEVLRMEGGRAMPLPGLMHLRLPLW